MGMHFMALFDTVREKGSMDIGVQFSIRETWVTILLLNSECVERSFIVSHFGF